MGAAVVECMHLVATTEQQHRRRTGGRGGQRSVLELVGGEHGCPLLGGPVERGLVDANSLGEGEMTAEPGGEGRNSKAEAREEPAAAAIAASAGDPGKDVQDERGHVANRVHGADAPGGAADVGPV